MKWIYKITYPNGKIYVGKDLTGSASYFGSPQSALIASDFSFAELSDFTIRRQILWSSESASDSTVNEMEMHYIRELQANNPAIGYNRWPKFRHGNVAPSKT